MQLIQALPRAYCQNTPTHHSQRPRFCLRAHAQSCSNIRVLREQRGNDPHTELTSLHQSRNKPKTWLTNVVLEKPFSDNSVHVEEVREPLVVLLIWDPRCFFIICGIAWIIQAQEASLGLEEKTIKGSFTFIYIWQRKRKIKTFMSKASDARMTTRELRESHEKIIILYRLWYQSYVTIFWPCNEFKEARPLASR